MPSFVDSTKTFLIQNEAGGGPPFAKKVRKPYRVYPNGPSQEIDIGIGYMLYDVKGSEVSGRRYWKGVDLYNTVLTDQQILDLFNDVWFNAGSGAFNKSATKISTECNLNQNQFDAIAAWIWAYGPYETAKGKRSATGALFDKIRQYKADLLSGYNDIENTWTAYCTTGGKPAPELKPRRLREFNLFFSNVTPPDSTFMPTGEIGNTDSTRNNTDQDTLQNANDNANLNDALAKANNNEANLELDDVDKSWGARNSVLEESDWIGLKQFLIYLCSTYYPRNLIPFVELIPFFSLDKPQVSSQVADQKISNATNFINQQGSFFGVSNDSESQIINGIAKGEANKIQNDYFQNSTGLDYNRYSNTADKIDNLFNTGGADLFSIDPFMEFTDSLNVPNDAGKNIIDKRGFGYKLYGNVVLKPGITDGALSKAGAIGFTSVKIESGSAVQNQMSLITMEILDVQGNKFTDLNSPWSFILNGSSKQGGDFYFRYGWQLRVPKVNSKYQNTDDETAEKFWNHPGWKLFDAETKKYILQTASVSDNTLTLTQSNDPESFRTPGYLTTQQSGIFQIQLDRRLDPFKYIPLTLVSPDISVNSDDGSITAKLMFRTQSAIANCLSSLATSSNMYNLFANTDARSGNTNLLDLITAFIKDNRDYINTIAARKVNPETVVDPINTRDWIQVIGTANANSKVDIDPATVPIKISQDLLGDLNRAYASKKDTRLLIEWLNLVLDDGDNGCKILTIGDQDLGGNSITGAIIVAYEKTAPQSSTVAASDSVNILTVSGAQRLQLQDDVFSFRFRGSLVESLGIDHVETTTAQTNEATQSLANDINNTNSDKNDVMGQTNQQKNSDVRADRNITLADKKRNLSILFSKMLKASIRCIAHPWLKIGRPIYVKGNGFFDGQYMVIKLTHQLDIDNKFITEIDCVRVINQDDFRNKQNDSINAQNIALNNPGIGKAQIVKPTVSGEVSSSTAIASFPKIATVTGPNNNIPIVNDIIVSPNSALGIKIMSYAILEGNNNIDANLQKYKNFMGVTSISNYDASYLSWVVFKATYDLKESQPFIKSTDIETIRQQFVVNGKYKDFIQNYYIPKKGDIVFWANHIGVIYRVTSSRAVDSSYYKIVALNTIELVNNKVTQVDHQNTALDALTNNGVRLLGFGVI